MNTLPEEQRARDRAALSLGISATEIHFSIRAQIAKLSLREDAVLIDVGCGCGDLWAAVKPFFHRFIGVDLVRHARLPENLELVEHNLDTPGIPLPDGCADVVVACEVLPQVENPRLVVRECARLCKPGGWVVLHHPNNLSLSSLVSLTVRQRFPAFLDGASDLMITPLLECDLLRMVRENGLVDPQVFYTGHGRIPYLGGYYPQPLAQLSPRLFSDNLGVIARKPVERA